MGKQTLVSYPDGSQASSVYDGVGNRTLAVDSTGRYTRTYDPLNRTIVSVQPHGGRLSFVWDAVGQRRLMIDLSGGRTTYTHDANGQITTLTNPQSDRTTFTYDSAGQRTRTDLGNGTSSANIYDAAGRVIQVSQLDAGTSAPSWATLTTDEWAALTVDQWATLPVDALETSRLTYRYDQASRKTVRTDLSGNRATWSYDAAGQLIGEIQTGPTPLSATWTYDPAGNRLTQHKSGDTTTYRSDAANRTYSAIDLSGRTTYSYDAAGNQTAIEVPIGDITTTTWDFEARQQAVEQPDGSVVTFTYNCDHWRVQREDAFETVGYQYDKNNLLAELDASNVVQVQYTNEPNEYGNLISQYRTADGEASYHAFDAIGSTIQLTDSTGLVTDDYAYEAWGDVAASTGSTTNPMQWIGQLGYYRDQDIGSTHVRRREYEAILARFKSEDPIRQEGGDNLYQYVTNDPVNRTDPSGLEGPVSPFSGGGEMVLDPKMPLEFIVPKKQMIRVQVNIALQCDPAVITSIKDCAGGSTPKPQSPEPEGVIRARIIRNTTGARDAIREQRRLDEAELIPPEAQARMLELQKQIETMMAEIADDLDKLPADTRPTPLDFIYTPPEPPRNTVGVRILGTIQAGVGGVGFAGGSFMSLGAPWWGLPLAAKGLDSYYAGLVTALSGEPQETLTTAGIKSAAKYLGFSDNTAGWIAIGVDLGTDLALGAAAALRPRPAMFTARGIEEGGQVIATIDDFVKVEKVYYGKMLSEWRKVTLKDGREILFSKSTITNNNVKELAANYLDLVDDTKKIYIFTGAHGTKSGYLTAFKNFLYIDKALFRGYGHIFIKDLQPLIRMAPNNAASAMTGMMEGASTVVLATCLGSRNKLFIDVIKSLVGALE